MNIDGQVLDDAFYQAPHGRVILNDEQILEHLFFAVDRKWRGDVSFFGL